MEKVAYVFTIIAGTLFFAGIAAAIIWLLDLVRRKPARAIGRAFLVCCVCFVVSCGIVGCAAGSGDAGGANGGQQTAAAAGKPGVTEEKKVEDTATKQTEIAYSKKAKSFAKKYKVPVELMGNLEEAIAKTDFPYSFEDMNGLEYTDDWAGGARYRVWHYDTKEDKYYRILVYEKNDAVSALYDITDGRDLIYAAADWSDGDGQEKNGIMLVDGMAGEYGKEATTGGETYFWYMVPSGVYLAENQLKYGTLYVVSDENAEDVRQTVQFTENGDTALVTVEEETHIELSVKAEILLIPAEPDTSEMQQVFLELGYSETEAKDIESVLSEVGIKMCNVLMADEETSDGMRVVACVFNGSVDGYFSTVHGKVAVIGDVSDFWYDSERGGVLSQIPES